MKQYQRMFEMETVDLTLAEEALAAIARKAIDRKTGARGLRSIMENILLDTMFDLPSLEGVEEVVISGSGRGQRQAPLHLRRSVRPCWGRRRGERLKGVGKDPHLRFAVWAVRSDPKNCSRVCPEKQGLS